MLDVGTEAPDFTLKDQNGQPVTLSDLRGAKNVKLTVYPGVLHDSWTQTYDDPAVWEWLFAQKRPADPVQQLKNARATTSR